MIYNIIRPKKTTPASDIAVGDSLYCTVNGVRTEFIVIQQGNPDSSIYDSSCDGTWLMMKYLSDFVEWNRSGATYSDSVGVYSFCNDTFYNCLNIKSIINQAKVPVYKDNSYIAQISSPVFPLSMMELGLRYYYISISEGTKLSYFELDDETESAKNKRIAIYDGTATSYWTRTLNKTYTDYVYGVSSDGDARNLKSYGGNWRVRPCFIIPSTTKIDVSGNILI